MIKEYTEEEIDRIFYSGTTKEKATLYLRDRMGYFKFGIPFLLNKGEPEILMDSVNPYEFKEWNKYISMGLRIENGFRDLYRFLNILMNFRDDLSKILSEMTDLEGIEEVVNESLLNCSSKDPLIMNEDETEDINRQIRGMSLTSAIKHAHFNKIQPVITPEGLFDFNPRPEVHNLFGENNEFRGIRDRAMSAYLNYRKWVENYLCLEEALRRRIRTAKLRLPEYEKLLSTFRTGLSTRQEPHSLRYEGFQDVRLVLFGEDSRSGEMFPYPAMIDLIEDLSVRIEDIDLNTEENQEQIKKHFNNM